MFDAIVQVIAAFWLVFVACTVSTKSGNQDWVYRVVPVLLAGLLGFQAYARLQGWLT